MSWTHSICEGCWVIREGDRPPVRGIGASERCCVCGNFTSDGIYFRENQKKLVCSHDGGNQSFTHDDLKRLECKLRVFGGFLPSGRVAVFFDEKDNVA